MYLAKSLESSEVFQIVCRPWQKDCIDVVNPKEMGNSFVEMLISQEFQIRKCPLNHLYTGNCHENVATVRYYYWQLLLLLLNELSYIPLCSPHFTLKIITLAHLYPVKNSKHVVIKMVIAITTLTR